MPLYAVIDVETTGGTSRYERITEIAIVLHDGEKVVNTFSTLLNPERSIPWSITRLTGITDEMTAGAPKFYEVAKQVVELTEGAIFVAHNAAFDYGFIREEFARLGYVYSRKQLCTVRLARKVFPGLPSYSLSNLKAHFGIKAEKSHRALDDALATVSVFERILEAQSDKASVRALVNKGVKETKLPPAITLERLHETPEACGVYYLYDDAGTVIYVGKSLNIRKRLFEHFADLSPKGEKMRAGVADLSYELTGSELAALLLESIEIKRLQPRINRALRVQTYAGCIFSYTDQNGYICLAAGKRTTKNARQLDIVADFPKVDNARSHLQFAIKQWELCAKLCNLDFHEHACFEHAVKKCRGACIGDETPESYNDRAQQAIDAMNRRLQGSFILVEPGRTPDERVLIGVREGVYQGFSYFDAADAWNAADIFEHLRLEMHDPDAARIIRGYMDGGKRKIVSVQHV